MGLLVSLLWLAAALVLARVSRRPWLDGVVVVLAAIAGTTLPDLDLLLPIGHRSGLTHSLLPLLAAFLVRTWRPVMAGLAIGIGLHLAADTFPNAMRGFATVKLPGIGSIGMAASYGWLAGQALIATLIGGGLMMAALPLRIAGVAAVVLVAIGIAYLYATDGGWPALCIYTLFGWSARRRHSTSLGIRG